jgi:hypothetical protein
MFMMAGWTFITGFENDNGRGFTKYLLMWKLWQQ